MADVRHEGSGRAMAVESTQPGVQFYTGRGALCGLTVFFNILNVILNVIFTKIWEPEGSVNSVFPANFLPDVDGLKGKGGASYRKHGGFCLETQNYPDAPNQPGFPDPILAPGVVYQHTTRYGRTPFS